MSARTIWGGVGGRAGVGGWVGVGVGVCGGGGERELFKKCKEFFIFRWEKQKLNFFFMSEGGAMGKSSPNSPKHTHTPAEHFFYFLRIPAANFQRLAHELGLCIA